MIWKRILSQKEKEKIIEAFSGDLAKAVEELKKKIKKDEYDFEFVITREVKDRHGEIVRVDGMDAKNFMKNPVLLADHNYSIKSIAGIFDKLEKDGDKIIGRGYFAPNDTGRYAKELYDGGFLKAVSIGFIPKKWNEDYTEILQWELLEVSLVAVPANPEALVLNEKEFNEVVKLGLIIKQEDEQEDEVVEDENADEVEDAEESGEQEAEEKDLKDEIKEIVGEFKKAVVEIKEAVNEIKDGIKEVKELIVKKDEVEDEEEPEGEKEKTLYEFKRAVQMASKFLDEGLHKVKKVDLKNIKIED